MVGVAISTPLAAPCSSSVGSASSAAQYTPSFGMNITTNSGEASNCAW